MAEAVYLVAEQRVLPTRGLIACYNHRDQPFDLIDIKRWLRLHQEVYHVEKVDAIVGGHYAPQLAFLAEYATSLDLRMSLRTNCSTSPDSFKDLATAGLLDVFLTPSPASLSGLNDWLDACNKAALPIRCQLQPPFDSAFDPVKTAETLAKAGVVVVNVALDDPFLTPHPCANRGHSRKSVDEMNALVRALDDIGIEANLIGLPLCLATHENLPNAQNNRQFFLDHQQYAQTPFEFAASLYRCKPGTAARAVTVPLGQGKSNMSIFDSRVLPFLITNPWIHANIVIWRRLTRKVRRFRGNPAALPETAEGWEHLIQRQRAAKRRRIGPVCSQCSLVDICDHATPAVKRLLPGIRLTPHKGEPVVSPMHFAMNQRKYYDEIDARRVKLSDNYLELAKTAAAIINNSASTREIDSDDYDVEGQWTHHMPGGNRWYSYSNTEKVSTPLLKAQPPFTISMTLGGGIAELAGFSFGRHCKILCPMETFSHQIALHVNKRGEFVLLRDGLPVRPTQFEGIQFVPPILAGVLEPRISLWNIEGSIMTQSVQFWEGEPESKVDLSRIKYSVFIMSTRYARRLQAVLLSLANQRGIDFAKLEVVIGYVPGIDATDDLIDSIRLSYPHLRIVCVPFAQGFAKSKGFVINESISATSGEWVALLDSDTILGPDTFARIDQVDDTAKFIAPDGRKMLPPDVTAQILLGNIKPWESWNELINGPGEFRAREAQGVPIGFFQCVRKECMDKVRYIELDHFEGADWFFGYYMREEFGKEHRLSGTPVLHLDHGGSQWFGTAKHR